MKRFLTYAHKCEEGALFVLFVSLFGLALVQVILRNVWGSGLVWADVAVRILLLWVAVFGAMVATRQAEHIQIDLMESLLHKPVLQKWANFTSSVCAAGVAFVVAFFSFKMVQLEYDYATIAFAQVPVWVTQSILPFGFFVMGLRFCSQAWGFFTHKVGEKA